MRKRLESVTRKQGVSLYVPPISLCGDNAAMIAAQGYYEYSVKNIADSSLNASALDTIKEKGRTP